MEQGFEIREAVLADVEVIANLQAANFDKAWPAGDVAKLLRNSCTSALIAHFDRTPVGYVMSRVAADEAEILSIAVNASSRCRGLGCAMMTVLEGRLRDLDCRDLFLEVDATNVAAIAFYASCGCSCVGMRRNYYKSPCGQPRDAIVMRRSITQSEVGEAMASCGNTRQRTS